MDWQGLLIGCVQEGKLDEYLNYHDNIWPEVVRGLRAAGITYFKAEILSNNCVVSGVTALNIFNVPGTRILCMYITTAGPIDLPKVWSPHSAQA